MQVIASKALRDFWELHPEAHAPLAAWYVNVSRAEWRTTHDLKAMYGSADFVGDNRVIFNVGGNKYRLVVHISYRFQRVLVKFVGTHRDYDRIDPEKI